MSRIVAEIAAAYRLAPSALRGRDRTRSLVRARQHAMAEIRRMRRADGRPRYSYPQIARFFGLAAHTSVLHAVRAHQRREAAGAAP